MHTKNAQIGHHHCSINRPLHSIL